MTANIATKNGFHARLWRGERMCMIGMDVDNPEPDFVGFAIEVKRPGAAQFTPLRNRLAFDYPAGATVNGDKQFASTGAPFQKFRWVHFPYDPQPGTYRYRITKLHMPQDMVLKAGTQLILDIDLDPVTWPGFLDIGFTRNFASSQAYQDKFGGRTDILPARADDGIDFVRPAGTEELYRWLGFEAVEIIDGLLDEIVADPALSLDLFAYDLNLGPMVAKLEAIGGRLRAIIDDSDSHAAPTTSESKAALRLAASAGAPNVRRTHFSGLQHHKVLIVKRGGKAERVLTGSTNFSYRGFYIQANNALLFSDEQMAGLFAQAFDQAFADPGGFSASPLAKKWHLIETAGRPTVHLCLSPHTDSDLSLSPVGAAIDQATSSALYSIAFLNNTKTGPVRSALDRLIDRPLFSYGVVDTKGKMKVMKPDGSVGLVDFAYLARNAPQPFKSEWSAGKGINIHNKFVVTDFNLPTAKVFTGSSNLSPSGEKGNGDHLLMIEDQAVATAYAIDAVLLFDHLHFRSAMQTAGTPHPIVGAAPPKPLTLAKPQAISGKPAWFARYYVPDSQYSRDRLLFGR